MSVQLQTKPAHVLEESSIFQKALLFCGAAASALYVFMNIICATRYPGYNSSSQTVSELSAIGAPTRTLWVSMALVYGLLMIGFGVGVWRSSAIHHRLQIIGIIFITNAMVGFFWPPMHQRDVIAAGAGTLTDTLHIAFTFITVPLMIVAIALGSSLFGKLFRWYSLTTLLVLVLFGILTGMDAPKLSSNQPTPWMGVWERINIGIYMLWVIALSVILSAKYEMQNSRPQTQ